MAESKKKEQSEKKAKAPEKKPEEKKEEALELKKKSYPRLYLSDRALAGQLKYQSEKLLKDSENKEYQEYYAQLLHEHELRGREYKDKKSGLNALNLSESRLE